MPHSIETFHHLGIITTNLSVAVEAYQRLGFLFTPLSLPQFPLSPGGAPEPVGVANRNAIFRNGYLEMLGVVDAPKWASVSVAQRGPFDIDRPLQRYEGLHVMHFGTDDLDAVRARLVDRGLSPSPVRPFHRIVDTPDGSALMRARSLSFARETNPEALFQIVQHETPELALQPRFMVHPNGARTLSEATLCVENPAEVAARYARYAGHPVEREGSLHVLNLGTSRLIVVDRKDLDRVLPGEIAPALPYFAGFSVTADVDHVAGYFRRQQIPFTAHDGRIIVSARNANGCAVVFRKEQS